MKQYQIINAYKATEKLINNDKLSAKDLWSIFQVRKALKPHWDFQAEREQALQEKYKNSFDENGNLSGPDMTKFIRELNEINNLEIEIESKKKPSIRWKDDCGITIAIVEALEDFIDFTLED